MQRKYYILARIARGSWSPAMGDQKREAIKFTSCWLCVQACSHSSVGSYWDPRWAWISTTESSCSCILCLFFLRPWLIMGELLFSTGFYQTHKIASLYWSPLKNWPRPFFAALLHRLQLLNVTFFYAKKFWNLGSRGPNILKPQNLKTLNSEYVTRNILLNASVTF